MPIQMLEMSSPGNYFFDVKDQLRRFVYGRSEEAFAKGDSDRDAVKTPQELEERVSFMRRKFVEGLGGLPSMNTPLNPRIVGTIECDGFRIEKVIFESRPGTFVTANLYIPDGMTSPGGAVLFVCGHHMQAKHADEYQIVCRYLVKAGLVVLAQDPVGQGERFSYFESSIKNTTVEWGVREHDYAGTQCWPLGDGIARYFVHDAMRGIDYLCTRPEVDPSRIGITGNSGGGTQSCLMMMCDTRLAAAAPATFLMNRQSYMYTGMAQDSEQIWPGMSAFGFDHEDILMAMAPKPVLVLAVTSDFFPIEGTRRSVERARRFWDIYGKEGCLELLEDDCDHHYTRPMAKAAAEFFSLHLLGRKVSPEDASVNHIEPSMLWCTKSGQVRGEIEGSRAVYDENLSRLSELEGQRGLMAEQERKEKALQWLKDRVFYNRRPCELNPRHYHVQNVYDFIVQHTIWWAQEGILNYAQLLRDYRYINKKIPVTVAVWDGGTSKLQPHIEWIRKTCSSGRAVMVLDVTGVGGLAPNPFNSQSPLDMLGIIYHINHLLMWLGDSISALRTYDVIKALDMVSLYKNIDSSDIQVYASGKYGMYGRLAAALDKRITGVETAPGMDSISGWVSARHYDHYDISSVLLPGMLKYFDLPDIDRWNADR